MNQDDPQTVSTPDRALTPNAQKSANLELKHKVLEVIALTPEVRSKKVQVLKELVAKGSYRCNPLTLASNLIVDHVLMTGLVARQPGTRLQNPAAEINASGRGGGNLEIIPCSK